MARLSPASPLPINSQICCVRVLHVLIILSSIYDTMRACGCVLSATRLKHLPFALQLWLAFAPPCWSTKKLSRRTGPFSTPYVTTRQTPCSSRELFNAPGRSSALEKVLHWRTGDSRSCAFLTAVFIHVQESTSLHI